MLPVTCASESRTHWARPSGGVRPRSAVLGARWAGRPRSYASLRGGHGGTSTKSGGLRASRTSAKPCTRKAAHGTCTRALGGREGGRAVVRRRLLRHKVLQRRQRLRQRVHCVRLHAPTLSQLCQPAVCAMDPVSGAAVCIKVGGACLLHSSMRVHVILADTVHHVVVRA